MARCAKCDGHLEKVRRTRWERLVYSAAYRCQKCKARVRRSPHWWSSTFRFVFSRYSVCVQCGTEQVRKAPRRDPLSHFSKHPLSLIQTILFAPRKECPYCRLQYRDLRPVARPMHPSHTG